LFLAVQPIASRYTDCAILAVKCDFCFCFHYGNMRTLTNLKKVYKEISHDLWSNRFSIIFLIPSCHTYNYAGVDIFCDYCIMTGSSAFEVYFVIM
jgi:hypothetical protein